MPTGDHVPNPVTWTPQGWAQVLAGADATRLRPGSAEASLLALYHPLMIVRQQDRPLCLGQLGQSLDGRIATASGQSHYINGASALRHLHCLRALVDAVVVGAGTVLSDDPQLTVRHVEGPSPARVVIDPNGRSTASARWLADDGCRRILVHAGKGSPPPGVESLAVAAVEGRLPTGEIVAGLAGIGLKRLLIEGGAATLSQFLEDGRLHRLHILTGPLIIGSGKPGLSLPPIDRLEQALRPAVRVFPLPEGDCIFDCALHEAATP